MLAQLVFSEMQGRFGDLHRPLHTAGQKAKVVSVQSGDDVTRQGDGGTRFSFRDDAVQREGLRAGESFTALLAVHRFQNGVAHGRSQRDQLLYGNGTVFFICPQEGDACFLCVGLQIGDRGAGKSCG